MRPTLRKLVGFLLVILVVVACGKPPDQETAAPTSRPAWTATPAPTPLPPLPTVVPLGSADNPVVLLFVSPDGDDALSAARSLSDDASEDDMIIEVRIAESYAEALQALCDGTAHLVSLNAFAYLAASQNGCGEALYLLEQDGELVQRSQMLTAIGRNVWSVEGFTGRAFCRADESSVVGWIIPSLVLRSRGVDPFNDLWAVVDSGSDEELPF